MEGHWNEVEAERTGRARAKLLFSRLTTEGGDSADGAGRTQRQPQPRLTNRGLSGSDRSVGVECRLMFFFFEGLKMSYLCLIFGC